MKKTYISPEFLVVKLSCKSLVAASSFGKNETGADDGVVLVKENNPPISDVNVWDDEW